MIYTSGTSRILKINEADNTKVGWTADNTASNGKLVFSDAQLNYANNFASGDVSVQLSYVSQMVSDGFQVRDSRSGAHATITRPSYDTFIFSSGFGGISLWKLNSSKSLQIAQVTPYINGVTMNSSDISANYIYDSDLYIKGTKGPLELVTKNATINYTFESPVMPTGANLPRSKSEMTYSYNPSPILPVSQTIPPTFSPITTNVYWSGKVTVWTYYVLWGEATPKLVSNSYIDCIIYRDGEISTSNGVTSKIWLPTRYGSVLVFFTIKGSAAKAFKTGRFYGTTKITRNTGYSGTANIADTENGESVITQTN